MPSATAPPLPSPTSGSILRDWRVPLGVDIHDGQSVTVDFDRDAHLLMQGELGWSIGPTMDAVLDHILARGAHLDLVTGIASLAGRFTDSPRMSHYTETEAAEAVEAFHASMVNAGAPAHPEDHRFLMIDGLNLLHADARDGDLRAENALDLLYALIVSGRRSGHHIVAHDWSLHCNRTPALDRLRAAFPAVLESVKPQKHFEDRAVLLAHTGAHGLRLPRTA